MKRGSISLARRLCADIAHKNGEYVEDWDGNEYGSVDIAEILSAEVERLRAAIKKTIEDNLHLADGEVCTLADLKRAINYQDD